MTRFTGRIAKALVLSLVGAAGVRPRRWRRPRLPTSTSARRRASTAPAPLPTNLAAAAAGPRRGQVHDTDGRAARHRQRRRARSGHTRRADRRHAVGRAAEHLHRLRGPVHRLRQRAAARDRRQARPAESTSSAPSSPACSPRWRRAASTSARRRSPPPTPGARPSASPTATTSATSRWWCRPGSPITGFDKLAAGQRIGVVQGTVQEAYVVDTLHLDPVKFPDYNTVYASLKTRQIDAWVAPSQQAQGTVQAGRSGRDRRKHLQPGQLRRLRGRQGEQAADRRAELRAGRGDRRRHLVAAVLRLGAACAAARLEARLQGGAAAAAARLRRHRRQPPGEPRTTPRRSRNRRCRSWRTRSSTGTCTSRPSPTCSRPACRTR